MNEYKEEFVYVLVVGDTFGEGKLAVYKDKETAEKSFYTKVERLKRDMLGGAYPDDYVIDENYQKEECKFCTIYHKGWFDEDNETVALRRCKLQ